MIQNRLIPVLQIRDGGLTKTRKFKPGPYVGDPINAVKLFNDMEVDEIALIDIDASKQGRRPNFDFIEEFVSECFSPLSYGGGVSRLEDAKTLFSLGVEKVIVNQALFSAADEVEKIVSQFGEQAVIGSVDIGKSLFGKSVWWDYRKKKSRGSIKDALNLLKERKVGEVLVQDVSRDGEMNGFDVELIKTIAGDIDVPLIFCGGAGSLDDCRDAVLLGSDAVAAGSLLVFQSKERGVLINYPDRRKLDEIFKKEDD